MSNQSCKPRAPRCASAALHPACKSDGATAAVAMTVRFSSAGPPRLIRELRTARVFAASCVAGGGNCRGRSCQHLQAIPDCWFRCFVSDPCFAFALGKITYQPGTPNVGMRSLIVGGNCRGGGQFPAPPCDPTLLVSLFCVNPWGRYRDVADYLPARESHQRRAIPNCCCRSFVPARPLRRRQRRDDHLPVRMQCSSPQAAVRRLCSASPH